MSDGEEIDRITERRPIGGAFDFMVRGWRPAAGWACTATVMVRGAIVPFFEMAAGAPVTQFDWVAAGALLGALGLARYRHLERSSGVTI